MSVWLLQLKSTAAAIGTDARDFSINKINDLTTEARSVAAEVYAKAHAVDEEHKVAHALASSSFMVTSS